MLPHDDIFLLDLVRSSSSANRQLITRVSALVKYGGYHEGPFHSYPILRLRHVSVCASHIAIKCAHSMLRWHGPVVHTSFCKLLTSLCLHIDVRSLRERGSLWWRKSSTLSISLSIYKTSQSTSKICTPPSTQIPRLQPRSLLSLVRQRPELVEL